MHRVTIPFRLCSLMHASLPPPSRKTCQMALPWPCTLLLCHNHPPAGTALGRTTRSKHKPIQTKSNSKEHTASKGRWKLGEWGEGSYRRCGGRAGGWLYNRDMGWAWEKPSTRRENIYQPTAAKNAPPKTCSEEKHVAGKVVPTIGRGKCYKRRATAKRATKNVPRKIC